ncbi:MAG TPA: phytanoyl-CoA dioxygenase family protein [Kofleriaceae bacterium]|nr:phytanoyl-CoA dioxygenase family protein [Kofleriaceae bacterium]
MDPLDRSIQISEEERRSGALSADHKKLGAMLLHGRGFVLLKNAVPEDLVTELRTVFRDIYADCKASKAPDTSREITIGAATGTKFWHRNARYRIFPQLTGPFRDRFILANPFAFAILRETLGDDLYCKSVSSDTCVKGALRQAPHRDLDFYDGARPFGATVNIPLMHCGLHNGPLEVWPGGSHLWHGEPFFKFGVLPFTQDGENPTVEALMEHVPSKKIELAPGDLLIRDPGMWHRGTPNPTDEPRTMLTTSYFRSSFYYDYGDPLHNLDEAQFAALDPAIKPLFAYAFDKSSPFFKKLQRARAFKALKRRRVLGAPFRIGERWYERVHDAVRRTG